MEILLSGKPASEKVLDEVRNVLPQIAETGARAPHLAIVQVGDDPSSTVYVRNKLKTSKKLGIDSTLHHLDAGTSQETLLKLIVKLNGDDGVHGILVQLPLPSQIDPDLVMRSINPIKDVDCLHPENVGRLWLGKPFVKPCTPQGIMDLLCFYGIGMQGKRVVIAGRSNIVGKPLAGLMLLANATVTICHSKTKDLPEVCAEADVLVAAVGKARLITTEHVKEGAVVIDVGVNRIVTETGEEKLVGDVDFERVKEKVYAISPVPGGVGPMTIAELMGNVLTCWKAQRNHTE